MKYDAQSDSLTIILGSDQLDSDGFEGGDFIAFIDDGDALVKLVIENASNFVADALAAGVKVEGAPKVPPPPAGIVWHGADSSMISAFGYDEANSILEVAFTKKGVYRYFDVPKHVYKGLLKASSKGSYMRDNVIGLYREMHK